MPITQDRMLNLISAGTELLNSFSELLTQANYTISSDPEIQQILLSLQNAGFDLHNPNFIRLLAIHEGLLDSIKSHAPSIATTQTIAHESGHFLARRRRNDRTRELMRYTRRLSREAIVDAEELERLFPSEPEITDAEIDMDELHLQIWTMWRRNPEQPMTYNRAAAIVTQMGQHNVGKQVEILKSFVESGRAMKGEFESEFIPREPQVTEATATTDGD